MPPVRMIRSMSPPAAAAIAPMDLAAVYSMASPRAMRRSTSMASLVPRWASSPPRPRTSFMTPARSYFPEKHSPTSCSAAIPPQRSGANSSSSSRTLSTILPPMNSRTDAPPPRCSTIRRHRSKGLCSTVSAQRMAMARVFRACPIIRRGSSGIPVIRAIGGISSTATGSYTKAGIPSGSAMSRATTHPRLEACAPWVMAARYSIMSPSTAKAPLGHGGSIPPRAHTASRVVRSKPASASSTHRRRKGAWSIMAPKGASSSPLWRIVFCIKGVCP